MQAMFRSLLFVLFTLMLHFGIYPRGGQQEKVIRDSYGAIIRGDTTRRQIALVLTGDAFADGGEVIRNTFWKHQIKGSFFLTGNFYANRTFQSLIRGLLQDGHYLGAHSDRHLLYADWSKRDSLLVTEQEFKDDVLLNYRRMASFGIKKEDAPYFIPPYEWYNSQIAQWTTDLGLQLVNFTPGTRSTADYTYPEMGNRYVPSDVIFESITEYEKRESHGLNGFILLVHIGTDPRRTDKFYHMLDGLLRELKQKNYRFVTITEMLGNDA